MVEIRGGDAKGGDNGGDAKGGDVSGVNLRQGNKVDDRSQKSLAVSGGCLLAVAIMVLVLALSGMLKPLANYIYEQTGRDNAIPSESGKDTETTGTPDVSEASEG